MNIQREKERREAELRAAVRFIPFSESWTEGIPDQPGVYVIWKNDDGSPCYVGESASLRNRMRNLGQPRKHTFSRKVKERLSLDDDDKLRSTLMEGYKVSYIAVQFGRKEIEEYLIDRWRETILNQ